MAQVVLQSPKGSALRAFSKLQLLARLLWVKLGGIFPIVFRGEKRGVFRGEKRGFFRGEKRGGTGYRLQVTGGRKMDE